MSGLPPGIQTPSRLTVLSTPQGKLTSRIFGHVRLGTVLAIVLLEVVGLSSRVLANTAPSPGTGVGTLLPSGWELCVLQGVGAAGTADNVANLDEWQVAEGGSTNNTAAYNPFEYAPGERFDRLPPPGCHLLGRLPGLRHVGRWLCSNGRERSSSPAWLLS